MALPPRAAASVAARATAPACPAMTICPGALKFAGATTSPCARLGAERRDAVGVEAHDRRHRALARAAPPPASPGRAARHEAHGVLERRARPRRRARCTRRASGPRRSAAAASSGDRSRSAATSADARRHERGCVFAVSVSSSIGPSKHSVESGSPSAASARVEHAARRGRRLGERLAHADLLRALTGEQPRDLHAVHRADSRSATARKQGLLKGSASHAWTSVTSGRCAAPQEMPAPSAHMSTFWPGLMRPSRTASSSAIGIEALEVLPYSSMLTMNFSSGKPSRSETCVMMRRFAWWATTQSSSALVRPGGLEGQRRGAREVLDRDLEDLLPDHVDLVALASRGPRR